MDFELDLRDDGGGADLVVAGGDFVLGHALRAQVLGSIYCDARRTDPLPVDARTRDADPRGYWGEAPGDRFGSTLWTLPVAKLVQADLARVEAAARASLQWMVRSGLARSIAVEASAVPPDTIELAVTLERATPLQFQELWEGEDVVQFGGLTLRLLAR